jgi:adenylate cyclase
MSGEQRRLAAVMFTDIVGYSSLTQKNERLALELLEEHRRIVRPIVARHNGQEIKTIGDAFLIEFPSALDATSCAIDIQERLHERNLVATESDQISVRIGLHVGDVVHRESDVLGDAVNVASRIEAFAEAGGICITDPVFHQVRNKISHPLAKLSEQKLKNIDLPMNLYIVSLPWQKTVSTSQGQISSTKNRIAVLPFVNISPDSNDEYLADGLTEELIYKLSLVKGLKVIARTSVMNYKKKEKKISEIGKELGVGTVVEGSVRKASNKIRVTVQLIDATTEEHLWASNYDRNIDDIFSVQDDVTSKVAGSLSTKFSTVAVKKDTRDIEAYTLYLKAVERYHESTEISLREAVVLFGRAVARDSSFVRAYAGLAHTWGRLASDGYENFTVINDKAEPAARRAIGLGPDSAEAHAAMANVHGYLDRFDAAILEIERAIRINPNLSEAYVSLGVLYVNQRSLDEALTEFQRAYELDPLSYIAARFVTLTAIIVGKEALALEVLARMREVNPTNPKVYVGFAEFYMQKGNFDQAQEMLDRARQINPSEPIVRLDQGVLYALTGRRKEAGEVLNTILNDRSESNRLYGQLFIQAALNNLDEAFKALMRQVETHSWPFLIKSLPIFEELRKDPRFPEFCRKVGIPA